MVFIYYFLFNIMIVENFYIKFLKCKYFEKYEYMVYMVLYFYIMYFYSICMYMKYIS